jgi:putative Mg2+ transporter-C (MgtC) family protein
MFMGQGEYIMRLLLASACGAVIGLERSRRQKEAGLRTHIIVCLGAALIMVISKYGFFDVVKFDSVQVDASRVAANIITGISFLGAGVIFLKGTSIRGLTTSAGLWTTSACGMAIGAGLYAVGIFTTVFMVGLQYFLHKYNLSSETIAATEIRIITYDKPGIVEQIKAYFTENDVEIEEFSIKRKSDGTLVYDTVVKHLKPDEMNHITTILNEIPEVMEINCNQ